MSYKSDKPCPECDHELIFYPDVNGDDESKFGVYICENPSCDRFEEEIYNDGDFE